MAFESANGFHFLIKIILSSNENGRASILLLVFAAASALNFPDCEGVGWLDMGIMPISNHLDDGVLDVRGASRFCTRNNPSPLSSHPYYCTFYRIFDNLFIFSMAIQFYPKRLSRVHLDW